MVYATLFSAYKDRLGLIKETWSSKLTLTYNNKHLRQLNSLFFNKQKIPSPTIALLA